MRNADYIYHFNNNGISYEIHYNFCKKIITPC